MGPPQPFHFLPASHHPHPWPCCSGSVSFVCRPHHPPPSLSIIGAPPTPAVSEGRVPRPLEAPCPAAHPGRHAALLHCPASLPPVLLQHRSEEVCLLRLAAGSPSAHPGSPVWGAWESSGRSMLMPALLPTPADLHHRGESDRDLHPLLEPGHSAATRAMGFRWVTLGLWRWAKIQGPLGGSQGSGGRRDKKGVGGRAPGL